jgi:hypothetical protein
MKKKISLLFIILCSIIALTLFSCKKDNDWSCKRVYRFYVLDSKQNMTGCSWTMTFIDALDNKTYDEIHAYENANTKKGYFAWYGKLWYVVSTGHCLPAYCPENAYMPPKIEFQAEGKEIELNK